MVAFENRYFKINKFFLCVIGQWVYQTVFMKSLTRFITFLSLTSAVIPQLRMLVKHIEDDWNFWTSEVERKYLQTSASQGRFFTLLYALNLYASSITFVLMSISPVILDKLHPLNETRPRQLVYAAKFPLDEKKYINWLLVHGTFTAMFNLTIMFSCEAMFAVTTQHVCGLFAIVRYAKILDSIFSPILFGVVGLNVILISSALLQTLNSFGNFYKTIKYGILGSGSMIHLFCLTLPAQNLMDSSMIVSYGSYEGEWYNLPIKAQKLIAPVILRSQLPTTLRIGKFYTMNMVTFSSLLKASISYFTLFSSMR